MFKNALQQLRKVHRSAVSSIGWRHGTLQPPRHLRQAPCFPGQVTAICKDTLKGVGKAGVRIAAAIEEVGKYTLKHLAHLQDSAAISPLRARASAGK